MSTRRTSSLALTPFVLAAAGLLTSACSLSSDGITFVPDDQLNTGGASGNAGSGGTAGTSGTAGTGGTSGSSGTGGTAGSAGSGGTAGTAGTGGTAGTAGSGGTGGGNCSSIPDFTGTPACDACIKDQCCPKLQACVALPGCANVLQCIDACTPNQNNCVNDCVQGANQTAQAVANALLTCVGNSCNGQCTTTQDTPPTITHVTVDGNEVTPTWPGVGRPGKVVLSVEAIDDGSIAQIDVYRGSTVAGTPFASAQNTGGLNYDWFFTSADNGDITVVVRDNIGQQAMRTVHVGKTFMGGDLGWNGQPISFDYRNDNAGSDTLQALAIDTAGGIIAVGNGASQGGTNPQDPGLGFDIVIMKIKADTGNLSSQSFIDSSNGQNGDEVAKAVTILNGGNVIVAGDTNKTPGTPDLRLYAARAALPVDGQINAVPAGLSWSFLQPGGVADSTNVAKGVAVFPGTSTAVIGGTLQQTANNYNGFATAVDVNTGSTLWNNPLTFDTSNDAIDEVVSVLYSPSASRVIIAGNELNGKAGGFVVPVSQAGQTEAMIHFGGVGVSTTLQAAAVGPGGEIYVCGSQDNGGFINMYVGKVAPNQGLPEWQKTYGDPQGGTSFATSCFVDPEGHLVVASNVISNGMFHPRILRIAPDGIARWDIALNYDAIVTAVTVDPAGYAIVGGYDNFNNNFQNQSNFWLIKLAL